MSEHEQHNHDKIVEHNAKLINNNPVNYPEGFKILDERTFQDKNGKDYKQLLLEDAKSNQHTVLVFPNFSGYEKIKEGNYVDGYVRIYNSYYTLVDYKKPERTLLENEKFISPNGEIRQK